MTSVQAARQTARPTNVADWMVDRLDEFTALPGSTRPKMPYDEVLDEARRPVGSNVLDELRREQAAFNQERRKLDIQNRPLAIGALAAPGFLLGSELLGGFGLPAARAVGKPAEFNIFPFRRALNRGEKIPIWKEGRQVFERANGMSAAEMGMAEQPSRVGKARTGEVHHRTPNEHANKLPRTDPNRLENLQAIPKEVHSMVTTEWNALVRSLGRQPTPAEIQRFTQKMDRLIEPYTLRRGLPRPPPRIQKPTGKP